MIDLFPLLPLLLSDPWQTPIQQETPTPEPHLGQPQEASQVTERSGTAPSGHLYWTPAAANF